MQKKEISHGFLVLAFIVFEVKTAEAKQVSMLAARHMTARHKAVRLHALEDFGAHGRDRCGGNL